MTTKSQNSLQADLHKLLQQGSANTQDALCSALEAKGHMVNQSKISRLLRKINAVKTKNAAGDTVYCLAMEPAPPALDSHLTNCILDIDANEQLIVIHTSPGAAQLIARVIDHHQDKLHTLGSLAGDDTIFIAPRVIKNLEFTLDALKELLQFN